MRINPLLITIMFCINTTSYLNAYSGPIYYQKELDLLLFHNGVSDFLDESRRESDDAFISALCAVIRLAPRNEANASCLLESIHKNLDKKIKRIEYLKGKAIDNEAITRGLKSIGLGIVSSCVTSYFYKKNASLGLSAAISFTAFIYGISSIVCGLNPYCEDEYLEKYHRMLEITKTIQKNYVLKVAN